MCAAFVCECVCVQRVCVQRVCLISYTDLLSLSFHQDMTIGGSLINLMKWYSKQMNGSLHQSVVLSGPLSEPLSGPLSGPLSEPLSGPLSLQDALYTHMFRFNSVSEAGDSEADYFKSSIIKQLSMQFE